RVVDQRQVLGLDGDAAKPHAGRVAQAPAVDHDVGLGERAGGRIDRRQRGNAVAAAVQEIDAVVAVAHAARRYDDHRDVTGCDVGRHEHGELRVAVGGDAEGPLVAKPALAGL